MSLIPSWSYTSMTDFENCPRAYQLRRVTKEFPPFVETEAIKHGNLIHKAFEDRIREGKALPEHLAMYEGFVLHMERKVMDGEWLELGAETEVVLDQNLDPVGIWGQMHPRPWFSKQAWYRGKFDIVARLSKKRMLIMDIKTGRRKMDNPQLELFAAVAFKYLPDLERIDSGYLWTKEGGKVDKRVFFREGAHENETTSPKSESEIWHDWLRRVNRLEQAYETNNWPCRPSGLCGYCDATPSQCDYSKK